MKRAFVLGAGLGTRLRPLTDEIPKPLLPIFGKPLITFALDHLISVGFEEFVINTHHLARQLEDFFASGIYAGKKLQLIHEPVLLETGGGIKNAEHLLGHDEPFVVYSGDILTDFDLRPLLDEHFRAGNDVTLALRKTGLASGVTLRDGCVVSISKAKAEENFDFANVSVWNSKIFSRIPSATKISFIPILNDWIRDGGKIGGVIMDDGRWFNIGSRQEYLEVQRALAEEDWRPKYLTSESESEKLLEETRHHLPQFRDGVAKISSIEKGGSDRKFYRITRDDNDSVILVKYDRARPENHHYVPIAQFLAAHQIQTPAIYFHDEPRGLIWIEDIGSRDLWSFRHENWPRRRALYQSALDEIAKMHSLPARLATELAGNLAPAFDLDLYLWEQNYFLENCLGRFFGVEKNQLADLHHLPALREIAEKLAVHPRVFVHRDFQSQNIMVREGRTFLIDFQGMRLGLAEYDLASLLYDPYVSLTSDQRQELLDYYKTRRAFSEENLLLCAMQRLMQALGAYGFLGLVKGNRQFLQYIPSALACLSSLTAERRGLETLNATLARVT